MGLNMKALISGLVRFFFVAYALTGASAFAQFISLHQFPVTYTKSTGLDAQGNYIAQTESFSGFKNQYAPYGVPGCVLGYEEFRSQCATVNGGLSLSSPGYSSYKEFKVYIPAGTTFFSMSGNLPQNTQFAVVSRLGQAPVRTAVVAGQEYETIRNSQNISTAFSKMQAGEEVVLVHNYGGNMSLSGDARLSASPLTQGVWLYVRVLTGDSIYLLGAVNEVNRTTYKQAYDQMVSAQLFGVDGDPTDTPCTTCGTGSGSNSGGTPTTNVLTGIDLSTTVVNAGVDPLTVAISPQPATASLPVCTVAPSNIGSVIFNQLILSSTATAALTQSQVVTVTCGSVSKQLTVNPVGSASKAEAEVVTAADGKVTLKVTITRPQSEVTTGAVTSLWVGGVIPANAHFFQTDMWFFLTASGWKQLDSLDVSTVAYSKGVPVTDITQVVEIPMGFTVADAAPYRLQIHVGYTVGNGVFRNLGSVWAPVQ